MATQKILILTLAGLTADQLWEKLRGWAAARVPTAPDEMSSADWPPEVRAQMDQAVEVLKARAFLSPVFYRSEQLDTWSTGDVLTQAMCYFVPEADSLRLFGKYEIYATWFDSSQKLKVSRNEVYETQMLYQRLRDAIFAGAFARPRRLILLIRDVFAETQTDEEMYLGLETLPDWWAEIS